MKRIIDEHGRIAGKVSVIDMFVLLIVLVLAAALFVKFNVLDAAGKTAESGTVSYTVTVYGVRDYTANALKPGDLLYDKNNSGGYSIGTIQDIQTADAKKQSELLDGTIVLGNKVDCVDVTFTVTASGAQSGGRYLVNKTYELNANSIRTFNTKFCTFEGTITAIEALAGTA